MIIDPLFSSTKLSEEGLTKTARIREAFSSLLYTLEDNCPNANREFSIMRTKLEEASFYAVKSLRNTEENCL